jgi:hypothetical protein
MALSTTSFAPDPASAPDGAGTPAGAAAELSLLLPPPPQDANTQADTAAAIHRKRTEIPLLLPAGPGGPAAAVRHGDSFTECHAQQENSRMTGSAIPIDG